MNKKKKDRSERPVNKDLEMIKRELEKSGRWPETADRLLYDLARSGPIQDEEGDETMLSIVVSDAMAGVDVTEKYPEFYQKMVQNPNLFRAFLDAIEVLEADQAGELESLSPVQVTIPARWPKDSGPVVEYPRGRSWIARWRQSVEQLMAIFNAFGPSLQPGFRSERGILEESSTTLIRSEFTVEDRQLGVQLTAAWADDPALMNLQLMVALLDDEEEPADFRVSSLMAGVRWGLYQQASVLNEYGFASFPPLPVAAITDETGEIIANDLQLTLYPII